MMISYRQYGRQTNGQNQLNFNLSHGFYRQLILHLLIGTVYVLTQWKLMVCKNNLGFKFLEWPWTMTFAWSVIGDTRLSGSNI